MFIHDLVTKGVETDFAASLGEAAEISMNAAYIDATFKEYRKAVRPRESGCVECSLLV